MNRARKDDSAYVKAFVESGSSVAAGLAKSVPDLGAALRGIAHAAREAWPGFSVTELDFIRHLARHLPARGAKETLSALHVADLYLALACAAGDVKALAAFQRLQVPKLTPTLERQAGGDGASDDVVALLLKRLLVAENGAPKIAEYSGRGPLSQWLRATATRIFIDLQRTKKEHLPIQEDLAERLASHEVSPELRAIKKQHREAFGDALREALGTLTSKERNVVRMHTLEGLTIDQIGSFYGVHRVTAFRWIESARQTLVDHTRERLSQRLKLSGTELNSLMGAMVSGIDVSLAKHLAKSKVGE
ncbi:MAG: sigma-70 family RNA polymerase sigma factor [Myxococcaceae bacterium]|nr:sigma-70 family RNA polymerase sigma factor [Myxococcaceae bacterium]